MSATDFIFVATCSWLCFAQLVAYVPLSLLRDIRNLAPTNLLANALILFSLAVLASFALATISGRHLPHLPGPLPRDNGSSAEDRQVGSFAHVLDIQSARKPLTEA